MKTVYFFSVIIIILTAMIIYSTFFDDSNKPKEVISYNCENEKITIMKEPETMIGSQRIVDSLYLVSDKNTYEHLILRFVDSKVTFTIRKYYFEDKYVKLTNCLKNQATIFLEDDRLLDELGSEGQKVFENKSCYISNPYLLKDFPDC